MKLLRYNDPLLGPRKLPSFENFTSEKSTIDADETFIVDVDKAEVKLTCSGSDCTLPLGSQVVYVVVATS